MNKETFLSVIRHVLSAVGAYILGKNIFGAAATDSFVQDAIGVAMGLISVIWSFKDKSITQESFEGAIRQLITFVGGLVVASGKLSASTLTTVLGFLGVVLPWLYAAITKSKNNGLANGTISTSALKTSAS